MQVSLTEGSCLRFGAASNLKMDIFSCTCAFPVSMRSSLMSFHSKSMRHTLPQQLLWTLKLQWLAIQSGIMACNSGPRLKPV